MFGGINENLECSNDLLIIKRGKPLQLFKGIAKGKPPCPRCQCTMDFFEKLNVVIVYGGQNDKSKTGPYFNDMFFLDVQTLSWINIELLNDEHSYPTRGAHCSCLVDNELIIFGGKNEKFFLKSDLLICNLDIFENSKFKKMPIVKTKKKKENNNKERESLNIIGEDKNFLRNNIRFINQFNKKIYSNKNSDFNESINSSIHLNNKGENSLNFFQNFPQLRNLLQEKYKEIDGINFNTSDMQKIKDIINGHALSS